MKDFKTFLTEVRTINLKSEKDFIKGLYDLESNVKDPKIAATLGQAAEYVEDNKLDRKVASTINNALSKLPNKFANQALADALADYIESHI